MRLETLASNWDAADGAIRTNTVGLVVDRVLRSITVASDTSNSGPAAVEIYLLENASGRLAAMLEHGMIWNGDVDGQVTWEGKLGPYEAETHSIRIAVQNFTGATINVYQALAYERGRP